MAKNKGYLVPGIVKTLDSRDEYPVADVNDIAGARHIVQSNADRFAIPKLRRKVGMECFVADSSTLFILINEPGTKQTSNTDWKELKVLSITEAAQLITSANLTSRLAPYAKITDLPNMTKYYQKTESDNIFAKKVDVYTKTESDTNFASKQNFNDLKTDLSNTVVEIVRPDIISVNYNTDIASITLPSTIDVVYGDGTTGNLNVNWDTSTYSKNSSGVQVLLGSLDIPPGTKNAIVNVIQHILVGAETHVILRILSPTVPVQITAKYDQPFSELLLPTRMQVEYEDGTTAYLDVDWTGAASVYDPQELAVQNLTGAFLLPANVSQPVIAVEPTAVVDARVKPLNIVSDAVITIPLIIEGTLFDAANFPTSNTVTLEDNSTTTLNIKWNKASYNPFNIGKQYLTGEYVLVDGVLNENDVTPGIVFEVGTKPDICDVIDPTSISTGKGVAVTDLVLPSDVTVKILAYDGTITTDTATVNWDRVNTTYNSAVNGDYYIEGDIVPPAGVTNLTGITTEILVKVVDGTTYVISSVPTFAQTLANGSTLSSISDPAPITINIKGSDGTTTTDNNVSVAWDADTTPAFDGTTAGNYTLYGTIIPNSGVTTPDYQNTGNLKAAIIITVEPPVVVLTYTIKSVDPIAASGTITEDDDIPSSTTIDPPNQVQVTLLCSDGTETTQTADISVWDYSNLDANGDDKVDMVGTTRTVEIHGTIDPSSIVGLNVTNPNGVVAKYDVYISVKQPPPPTRKTVESVTTVIPSISMNYNQPVTDLITELAAYPTVDITVIDQSSNITNLSGVAVNWVTSSYDMTMANSNQVISGILVVDSNNMIIGTDTDPVYNDNNITAQVTVLVGSAPAINQIDSYVYDPSSDSSIIVENGTLESDIVFPTTIKANCTESGISVSHTLPIIGWAFSSNNTAASYDGTVEGDYKFTPTIDNTSLFNYIGTPTVPDVNVHVNAAPVATTTTYLTSEYGVPNGYSSNTITGSGFSDVVFNKLIEIATSANSNGIEDAWMGEEDPITETGDLSKRTVEFRYMGTSVYPIAGGVRIPSEEEITNNPTVGTDFQNKLVELGVPDGTFGSLTSPIHIVAVNIDYTTSIVDDAKDSSWIQFNQATLSNAIIQIRVVDQGTYIDDDPNSY